MKGTLAGLNERVIAGGVIATTVLYALAITKDQEKKAEDPDDWWLYRRKCEKNES